MRLRYRHHILNLHRFTLIINPVKCSPGSPDMQTIEDESIFQAEFFFIPALPGIGILTERNEFRPDNPSALFIKIIDLFCQTLFDGKIKDQSLISERETNVPSSSIFFISLARRNFFLSSIISERRSVYVCPAVRISAKSSRTGSVTGIRFTTDMIPL